MVKDEQGVDDTHNPVDRVVEKGWWNLPRPRLANIAVIAAVGIWLLFQWRDPTPPPVLDQVLVLVVGAWFTNVAIEKKKEADDEKADK